MVPFLDSADAYPAVKRRKKRHPQNDLRPQKLEVNPTPSCPYQRQAIFYYQINLVKQMSLELPTGPVICIPP
jgi:hypothetical protein